MTQYHEPWFFPRCSGQTGSLWSRAPVLFLFMFVYSGIGIYLAQRSLNSTFSTLYFSEFHSVTESEGWHNMMKTNEQWECRTQCAVKTWRWINGITGGKKGRHLWPRLLLFSRRPLLLGATNTSFEISWKVEVIFKNIRYYGPNPGAAVSPELFFKCFPFHRKSTQGRIMPCETTA